jgi:hypothetical protein
MIPATARIIAPPTPTQTPMMVLFVPDKPLVFESVEFWDKAEVGVITAALVTCVAWPDESVWVMTT